MTTSRRRAVTPRASRPSTPAPISPTGNIKSPEMFQELSIPLSATVSGASSPFLASDDETLTVLPPSKKQKRLTRTDIMRVVDLNEQVSILAKAKNTRSTQLKYQQCVNMFVNWCQYGSTRSRLEGKHLAYIRNCLSILVVGEIESAHANQSPEVAQNVSTNAQQMNQRFDPLACDTELPDRIIRYLLERFKQNGVSRFDQHVASLKE
jgi:hypothetical protein